MLKIFANFFFARDNTMSPFKVSSIVVTINIAISLAFFKQIGFIIIPIATSISTWVGVIIYIYLLNNKNFLLLKNYLPKNILKSRLAGIQRKMDYT